MPKLFQKMIEQILSSVGIQGKNAEALKKELESNLLDQKEYLMSQGMTSKKAEKIVVEKFGDPAVIGEMLRRYGPASKNIRRAEWLARIVALASVLTGLYYGLSVKFGDIRLWAVFAIIGGIGALIASKVLRNSQFLQKSACVGFTILALGQTVPIWAGIYLISRRFSLTICDGTPLCSRITEVFFGLGIHLILFIFCSWIVIEILNSSRKSVNFTHQ